MAENKNAEGAVRSDVETKDAGPPYSKEMRSLAEDLPEKDEVQKAYKKGFLADTAQEEAKAKVAVVDASPDADETPSGYALQKVAGISSDEKRGEEYMRHKMARRFGYVPADKS